MNYLRSIQTNIADTDWGTKHDSNRGKRIATYIAFASLAVVILSVLPEIALAGKFDIDAGVIPIVINNSINGSNFYG